MKLMNQTKNILLAQNLEIADGMLARMQGLLGRTSLPVNSALMIKKCNSIHTFFMRFPIDVAFVDKDLKVCRVEENVSPWRITAPSWRAQHCFEFAAGSISGKISSGDQLHVGA